MTPNTNNDPHYGLVTLAAACAILVGMSMTRFGYAPLLPVMVQDGWFTTSQAAYLGGFNLIGYLAGALGVRSWVHFVSPRDLIRLSLVLTLIGFVASSIHFGFLWLALWRLLSGVTGGVLVGICGTASLGVTPPEYRGRVTGFVFTGIGIGFIISGLLVPALTHNGASISWLGLGACALILSIPGFLFWPRSLATRTPRIKPETETRPGPELYLLRCAYACDALAFVPHTVFLVDFIARGLEMGMWRAGTAWTIFGLGACCGPLTSGFLAERVGFHRALGLAYILKTIAISLAFIFDQYFALLISAFLVGAMTPATTALNAGRIGEIVPPASTLRAWSSTTCIFALGQATGGFLFSALFDAWLTYRPLFIIATIIMMTGTAIYAPIAFFRKRQEKQ